MVANLWAVSAEFSVVFRGFSLLVLVTVLAVGYQLRDQNEKKTRNGAPFWLQTPHQPDLQAKEASLCRRVGMSWKNSRRFVIFSETNSPQRPVIARIDPVFPFSLSRRDFWPEPWRSVEALVVRIPGIRTGPNESKLTIKRTQTNKQKTNERTN